MPHTPQLKEIVVITDSMRGAFLSVSNDSDMVFIKGEIDQIMNLHKEMAVLGYRQKGGIQFFPKARYSYSDRTDGGRIKTGKRDEGAATFVKKEDAKPVS